MLSTLDNSHVAALPHSAQLFFLVAYLIGALGAGALVVWITIDLWRSR